MERNRRKISKKSEIFRKRKIRRQRRIIFRSIIMLSIVFIIGALAYTINSKYNLEEKNISEEEQLEGFIVTIDAGHGDWDSGAVGANGVLEKDVNLGVTLKLGKILEEIEGISVVYTRKNDTLTDWPFDERENLMKRVEISNKYNSDVFLSIHCNSGLDHGYCGVETWYDPNDTGSSELAKLIQEKLVAIGYATDRGLKESEGEQALRVISYNNAAAVLLELGFITNSADEAYLASEGGQATIAQAIAEAVVEYKELTEVVEEDLTEESDVIE